jgi:hypothetical protein
MAEAGPETETSQKVQEAYKEDSSALSQKSDCLLRPLPGAAR